MSVITWAADQLDSWSKGRNPSPADSRHLIGSWAAKSLLQYFAVEWIVFLSWSDYAYWRNVVSDLGARGCHSVDGQTTCRSAFVAADLSFILIGVGVTVAALLITSTVLRVGGHSAEHEKELRLSRAAGQANLPATKRLIRHLGGEHEGRELTRAHHLTTATRFFMAVAGLAVVGVGVFPEDFYAADGMPWGHMISTAVFLVCAIVTLVLLGILWLRPRPVVARILLGLAAVASVGGTLFLIKTVAAIAGHPEVLGDFTGLYERGVIYGFIVGMAVMGWALSSGAHRRPVAEGSGKHRGSDDGVTSLNGKRRMEAGSTTVPLSSPAA
ncbi:DUF998 domain-containing protein [Sinomonas sp. P47F7]|uniref:DUF998 domain-containing protein n=1 Tax=Sinomonas sp. P47F7 TaxID=3410987 RepID=UPI003BF4EBEB